MPSGDYFAWSTSRPRAPDTRRRPLEPSSGLQLVRRHDRHDHGTFVVRVPLEMVVPILAAFSVTFAPKFALDNPGNFGTPPSDESLYVLIVMLSLLQ